MVLRCAAHCGTLHAVTPEHDPEQPPGISPPDSSTTPDGAHATDDIGWLAVPDIMEWTGASLPQVRGWLHERELIGVRRGPNHAVMVPERFLTQDGPLASLRGTITVLADSGLDDSEIVEWLHRPDADLTGGSAIEALQAGRKSEVRRRAQEVAF